MKDDEVKKIVQEKYAQAALRDNSCGCTPSCCGTNAVDDISKGMGYSEEDLKSVPDESNLGLGCGNPVALASLKEGETVVDLGSGAGFDCFMAANKVGKTGRVIGVDMTLEMIDKAQMNAEKGSYDNVEFRLGEIEKLPLADNMADVIISNCVINLSPNKDKVFAEAFRVLKPGGQLMISDIVLKKELPKAIKESVEAYVGCIAGAIMKEAYLDKIRTAGFINISVVEERTISIDSVIDEPTAEIVTSINVSATKP